MSSAATSGVPFGRLTARSSSSIAAPVRRRPTPRRPAARAPQRVPPPPRGSKPSSRWITARHSAMRAIDVDEERQRRLHAVEGGGGLHQAAELHRAGEIGRADHDIGKHHRGLRIARGEERQPLGAGHDLQPVADHAAEAFEQALGLRRLAVEQRDLLGILAHAHQIEPEVGLEALLLEIEPDQRPADQMGQNTVPITA